MLPVWARRSQMVLGLVYAALGTVLTVVHLHEDPHFWFLTLCGGAALVLAGSVSVPSTPVLGGSMVCLGATLGFVPTLGTVVVPLLALVVLGLTMLDAGERVDARPT